MKLSQQYQTLKQAPEGQQLEKWLQLWEKTYTDAQKVALPEVQNENPLYNFITAIKDIDPIFAGSYEVALEKDIHRNIDIPSIFDLIETFRNHIQIDKAVSRSSHSAFTTLHKSAESASNSASERSSRPFHTQSTQSQSSRTSSYRPCLCGDRHRYSEYSYLNIHARQPEWASNTQVQANINIKLLNSLIL